MANVAQRSRPLSAFSSGGRLAALDIGCSKVSCLIGRKGQGPDGFELAGGGRQQSRGFTGGAITDMEGLERSIRLAVEDAERQAGEQIEAVTLGITGPRVASQLVSATTDTSGREITPRDVRRVLSIALAKAETRERQILSAYPVAYMVDDQPGVREPVGMLAVRLGVFLNVVTAPRSLVANLVECVSRAHLRVDGLVPSAVASGAGTLIEDEKEHGAICIDMGAGVTTASVFLNGAPAWVGLAKTGGAHVTADIAQGVGTTFAAAERLKTVYGTADMDGPGAAERIECPVLGDDGRLNASRIKRGELAGFITPRVEETFELIQQRLAASKIASVLPRRVVLTGGASQLNGVRDVATRVLNMPVRLGRPAAAERLGEDHAAPCFSTVSGLLTYELAGFTDVARAGRGVADEGLLSRFSGLNRAFSWLRENF